MKYPRIKWENDRRKKLSKDDVIAIKKLKKEGIHLSDLADHYQVSISTIRRALMSVREKREFLDRLKEVQKRHRANMSKFQIIAKRIQTLESVTRRYHTDPLFRMYVLSLNGK